MSNGTSCDVELGLVIVLLTAVEAGVFLDEAFDRRVASWAVDRGIAVGLWRGLAPEPTKDSAINGGDCEAVCKPGLGRVASGWRASCLDAGILMARGTVASLVLETPCWLSYVGFLCDMSSGK